MANKTIIKLSSVTSNDETVSYIWWCNIIFHFSVFNSHSLAIEHRVSFLLPQFCSQHKENCWIDHPSKYKLLKVAKTGKRSYIQLCQASDTVKINITQKSQVPDSNMIKKKQEPAENIQLKCATLDDGSPATFLRSMHCKFVIRLMAVE